MAKRRTKKDKEKVKRNYAVSWDVASGTLRFEPGVNRQLKNESGEPQKNISPLKKSDISAEVMNIGTITKDIKKSLMLSGLILTLELVLYFVWK